MKMSVKSIIMSVVLSALMFSGNLFADTHVKGYYRSNGSYVGSHWRSSANSTHYDNWSYRHNVNPYTGKIGSRNY